MVQALPEGFHRSAASRGGRSSSAIPLAETIKTAVAYQLDPTAGAHLKDAAHELQFTEVP
jgi:hypothetical protein